MSNPKPISPTAIPAALEKAVRYRLLNQPGEAESICRDVLEIDPDNHEARVTLLLALTDQLSRHDASVCATEARKLAESFESPYERFYYMGIVHERNGKALYRSFAPRSAYYAYDLLREAMHCYEEAEKVCPAGNEDAVLRWNSCVRTLARHPDLRPVPWEENPPLTLE